MSCRNGRQNSGKNFQNNRDAIERACSVAIVQHQNGARAQAAQQPASHALNIADPGVETAR